MKKLFLTLLAVAFITVFSFSQNKVIFEKNNKYYLVYFPNGFTTTDGSISWSGAAVGNQICGIALSNILTDINLGGYPSKICSEAKNQAYNAGRSASARCGPNYGANASNSTVACADNNSATCSFSCLDVNGSQVWWFFSMAVLIQDSNQQWISLDLSFVDNNNCN